MIKNYYDSIAKGYDELYGEEQHSKWNNFRKLININKDEYVLDVGCGTGIISEKISIMAKKVIAVDISPKMLKIAQSKRLHKNIKYLKANAEKLPFEDKSFEKVVSFTTLQDVIDIEKAISEIARVCKIEAYVTVLKRNYKLNNLVDKLDKYFEIEKFLEDEKDFMFVLKPKFICKPLPLGFFQKKAEEVAKKLLGKYLCNNGFIGKIVETEAYYGQKDPASRAFKGKNKISELMFDSGGKILIYMVHSRWLMNFVTGKLNDPQAVLIRAIEPIVGIEKMKELSKKEDITQLCNGPGKLTYAMGINKNHHGQIIGESIHICDGAAPKKIISSHRIGVSKDLKKKLRFYIANNRFVSKA